MTNDTPQDNIIETLKKEHVIINTQLRELVIAGIETHAGKQIFHELKALLFNHLHKEDHFVYPSLKKQAENNLKINEFLVEFEEDLLNIIDIVKQFENRLNNHDGDDDLSSDLEYLFVLLTFRMTVEEETIFKDFGDTFNTTQNINNFQEGWLEL